jgi:glyoxylase-like metal-dependent hydrolase (beta-lactamase superfamily II)
MSVEIGRPGAAAVITGDMIHSPLQLRYPELTSRIDHDPGQAIATRRAFLERHCDTDTVVCFSHFPSPSWGLVRRWEDGFRSEPVP